MYLLIIINKVIRKLVIIFFINQDKFHLTAQPKHPLLCKTTTVFWVEQWKSIEEIEIDYSHKIVFLYSFKVPYITSSCSIVQQNISVQYLSCCVIFSTSGEGFTSILILVYLHRINAIPITLLTINNSYASYKNFMNSRLTY